MLVGIDDATLVLVGVCGSMALFCYGLLRAMQEMARATNGMRPLGPPTGVEVSDRTLRIVEYRTCTWRAPVCPAVPPAQWRP